MKFSQQLLSTYPSGLLHAWRSEYPVWPLGSVRRNRRIGIERLISHLRYVPGSKLTHYIGDGEPSHLQQGIRK